MNSELVLGEPTSEVNNTGALVPLSVRQIPTIQNATNAGTFYYKVGTRVFVNIAVTGAPSSSAVTLFTLPQGYRPSANTAYCGYTGGHSTNSETPKGFVTSSGSVTCDASASGTVNATVTFDAFY